MSELICPVCREELNKIDGSLKCKNNHSFDFSKEGYVNLLITNKSGELIGDNKDMAKSRQDFLSKGYFSSLKNALADQIVGENILDICCGEGYYDDVAEGKNLYAFDISKEMVRLAAKKNKDANYFVANISNIPIKSESIDFAFHLFAPFNEKEFSRVTKKGGKILTVVPGARHLFSLKEALYDTPYENDENPPKTEGLCLKDKILVKDKIFLDNKEDVESLFKMTPYYYHTSPEDKEKLPSSLETEIEFALFLYER